MRFPDFCGRGSSARWAGCGLVAAAFIGADPGRARAYVTIAPQLPPVSDVVGNYGVSYVYQSEATASGNTSIQNGSDFDNKNYHPASPSDIFNVPDSYGFVAAPTFPTLPITTASFHTYGSVGGGGVMKAYAEADGQNGTSLVTARVEVTFLDRVRVTQGGLAHFGTSIDGTFPIVSFGSAAYATASATTQLFVWSGSIPTPGHSFVPAYYEQHALDPTGDTLIHRDAPDVYLTTGDWWIAGALWLTASVNIPQVTSLGPADPGFSVSGVADFADTVSAHIDPSDEFSNLVYTTASGADYTTPVPEPACVMAAAVLAPLMLMRRSAKLEFGN